MSIFPRPWPETTYHASASILSTVVLGDCLFFSSLLPLLFHFFFFSSPFPPFHFFGLPLTPSGPHGHCLSSLGALWTQKVVYAYVENNLAWGEGGITKRKAKIRCIITTLLLPPVHDHSFQADILLSRTQLCWVQFYSITFGLSHHLIF